MIAAKVAIRADSYISSPMAEPPIKLPLKLRIVRASVLFRM